MKKISVADCKKIQSHLAEIWKVLYANGLEDIEFNRSPKSKQKKRMCEMLLTYNKDHVALTDGFRLCVSDHDSCWHCIEFAATKEEEETWKRREDAADARIKRDEKKEQRRRELEEEHLVAYWHKHFTTPYWSDGWSSCRFSKQNAEGDLKLVGPQPDDFVHWLYHGADAEGHFFSDEARVKYMKKYGLDKDYDINTGYPIKDDMKMEDSTKIVEVKKEDKAKQVKDYLRKKFEDGSWKDEARESMLSMNETTIEEYLDSVREFIRQQEEFNLHGIALYGINEERTKAHEALLDEYGFNGNDEKSDIARDITKSIDFVGECKLVNGKMKTTFYPVYEASLRLAYALDVVEYADEYLKVRNEQ